jgi:uncharacterized protein YggE
MEQGLFSSKKMRVLAGFLLFSGITALASYTLLNIEKLNFLNPMPTTISVSGEGEVLAVPDVGEFSFSVTGEGENASEAQADSAEEINAILAYLEEQGIEERDIKTDNYNLYPRWRYEPAPDCPFGSNCPNERVQDGFEVNQTVSVKVRDTEQAGDIISGVGDLGATNISNLRFTVDDTDALQAEAREQAIDDAQAKAEVLAEQLGVKIVKITNYYEDRDYYQPYMDTRYQMEAMGGDQFGMGGGANLPVGEDSTTVRVNITYEVK